MKAEAIITHYENMLKRYKGYLKNNPNSTFYLGLAKNTAEYIEKLKKE